MSSPERELPPQQLIFPKIEQIDLQSKNKSNDSIPDHLAHLKSSVGSNVGGSVIAVGKDTGRPTMTDAKGDAPGDLDDEEDFDEFEATEEMASIRDKHRKKSRISSRISSKVGKKKSENDKLRDKRIKQNKRFSNRDAPRGSNKRSKLLNIINLNYVPTILDHLVTFVANMIKRLEEKLFGSARTRLKKIIEKKKTTQQLINWLNNLKKRHHELLNKLLRRKKNKKSILDEIKSGGIPWDESRMREYVVASGNILEDAANANNIKNESGAEETSVTVVFEGEGVKEGK